MGLLVRPGPLSFEIRSDKVDEGEGIWGFILYAANEKQKEVWQMLQKADWKEVARRWGSSSAGACLVADYIMYMRSKKGEEGMTQQQYDLQAPRTVMAWGLTAFCTKEKLEAQAKACLMKVGYPKEQADRKPGSRKGS